MLKHFKVIKKEKRLQIDPDLAGALATFLVKLIGVTVKDKLLRASLAALVTALTAYFVPQASLPSWDSSSPEPVQPAREEGHHRTTCDAVHLDWPDMAVGR